MKPSHPPPAQAGTSWPLVVLLGAVTAMGPLAIDMYLPGLPAIRQDLGASASDTQMTMAMFLAGMAIGQLIYGPASDRFGRKPPVVLGAALYVAGSVACALAESGSVLVISRFVQALGASSGAVVARAIVSDRFGHTETARVLSLMMLIMGLAPILAPLFGGALLTIGGWRSIFWVMATYGLVLGCCLYWRLAESRSKEFAAHARSENPLRAYASLFRTSRLVGYALAGALNGAVMFTYVSSSPQLLIDTYHIPPSAFGWVFGANGIGIVAGNQINRHLLRRRLPDAILSKASLVCLGLTTLLFAAAMTDWGGAWTILPLLFLMMSSYGFVSGNTMAGALKVDPRRAGSISAIMGSLSFGAGAVASWGVGELYDGTAKAMALVMMLAAAGSVVSLRMLAFRERPRPVDAQQH